MKIKLEITRQEVYGHAEKELDSEHPIRAGEYIEFGDGFGGAEVTTPLWSHDMTEQIVRFRQWFTDEEWAALPQHGWTITGGGDRP